MTGQLFPPDPPTPATPKTRDAPPPPPAMPAAAPAPTPVPGRDIYSVSRLNREVRMLIEGRIASLWLEAEICNLSMPSSGHWYFALKDRDAQIRCAMFRTRNSLTRFKPKEGQKVLVRGRVSLYEARGEFQLVAETMEDAGAGALAREFDALKARLNAEGLFATERKRALPRMPRRIGVITSPTGAAIRDILHILARRFPAAQVLIFPVPVQGPAAAPALTSALHHANERGDTDVLIVARGGGSPEDLWAFNDEIFARAIVRSRIPVISGVGHEVDFTIADFVADVRAPTPSGAAELVVPDGATLLQQVTTQAVRLRQAMQRQIAHRAERFDALARRLRVADPGAKLAQQAQRLDELEQRLVLSMQRRVHDRTQRHADLARRMQRIHPAQLIAERAEHLDDLAARVLNGWSACLAALRHRLALASRGLDTVSPLSTLARGFAMITLPDGTLVQDAAQLQAGDRIEARVAKGSFSAVVASKS